MSKLIELKSPAELETLRESARLASTVLSRVASLLDDGLATYDLEIAARREIEALGASPAFLGYRGYPAALCVSLNDELVHGIPSRKRKIRAGDIVTLDLGVIHRGFFGDVAATFPVGKVSAAAQRLIKAGKDSFAPAIIENLRAGKRLGDLSGALERHIISRGFSVVRDYVGHGIGRRLHEEPAIPNFGERGLGPILKEGMVLAVEPMMCEGSSALNLDADGWTARTSDGKLSCHFEHMIIVGAAPEIITFWGDKI
ncbi:MAG: type I methionyl aminopeptidase [Endomicrobiia bacterium]|nr:type I methionyl aminopeptidase [Endomicrobiia bacterium]